MKRLCLLIAATLCMVSSASACSCAPPMIKVHTPWAGAQWYVQKTPVIFQGKVEAIRMQDFPFKPVPGKSISNPRLSVSFSEVEFYRGESSGSVDIQTGLGGGDCGYPFEPGSSYLVFAYKDDSGALETGICSGTRLLEDASTAIRVIRGDPPLPEDLQDQSGTSFFSQKNDDTVRMCGKVSLGSGPENAHAENRATVYLWLVDEVAPLFRAEDTETNRDGSFCFNELYPGKYILGARTEPSRGFRYVAYYPGVTERSQAIAITVSKDAHPAKADFPLLRQKLFTVAGYLRGTPDADNGSISVLLMPASVDQLNVVNPAELAAHGRFQISDVPPGHYLGYAASQDDEHEKTTFVSAGLELDVTGNMEGVRLDYAIGK